MLTAIINTSCLNLYQLSLNRFHTHTHLNWDAARMTELQLVRQFQRHWCYISILLLLWNFPGLLLKMTPHKSAGFLEAPLKPSLGEKCQHFQIFCCKIRTQSLEVLPWALGSVAPARPQALQFYLSVCLTRRQILQEFTSLTSPRAGDDATSAKAVYNDQHRTLHVLFRRDLCK